MSVLTTAPAGPPAAEVRGKKGGVGRSNNQAAEAVSDYWRRGSGTELIRRRRASALSLLSVGALGAVAAYQTGVIKHLPDPPGPFDSDAVDASGEAYVMGQAPDAAFGVLNAAMTLALVAAGGKDRVQSKPWLPLALGLKAAMDAGYALYLTAEQASKHRRTFCFFCMTSAAASLATFTQVLPDARTALAAVRR
jgi:uncharacterized membrane protein